MTEHKYQLSLKIRIGEASPRRAVSEFTLARARHSLTGALSSLDHLRNVHGTGTHSCSRLIQPHPGPHPPPPPTLHKPLPLSPPLRSPLRQPARRFPSRLRELCKRAHYSRGNYLSRRFPAALLFTRASTYLSLPP